MGTKYKVSNPEGTYFLTLTVVEWADVFTRRDYCELICESITYCQEKKDLTVYAWCVMTNHVHMICSAPRLPDVIRDLKKYTSRHLVEAIKNNPKEGRKTGCFGCSKVLQRKAVVMASISISSWQRIR